MEDNITPVDLGHDDVEGQECKDGRSRTWMILLYEDNADHKAVLDGKLAELDWNYAGRAHDMEGKLHHHVVVLFKDGRKNADIADDLGIDKRWLRAWDRQKKALRYLCHRDNPEKYQYSTDGIYGTIAEKAVAACSKGDALSESQAITEIVDILNGLEDIVSYSYFIKLMAEKGYFAVFRRLGIIGVRLLDEHNNGVQAKLYREINREHEMEKFQDSLRKIKDMPFDEVCDRLARQGLPPLNMD